MSDKKDKDLEIDILEMQNDIDYLYELLQPKTLSFGRSDIELDYQKTIEVTDEVYKEIYKYSENKKFIFVGVA